MADNFVNIADDTPDKRKISWQEEMLKRLQNSAAPVPIKVACTVTPQGKPDFLGEEYHGSINREEERKILEGKNGRYIVRESFSNPKPNEFTLAFNFDDTIHHIRLVYDSHVKEFRTDSATHGFKTVLELITDVVNLYQKLKMQESLSSPSGSTKRGAYNKSHQFKTHSYKHPKWCDVCGNFLWGLVNQGEKCEDCGINCHKSCCQSAPTPCTPISRNLSKVKSTYQKEEIKIGKQNSKNESNLESSNYFVISPKNPMFDHCKYFIKCSRFISAFGIRDSFIDIKSNMTRCFCNNCISSTSNSEVGNLGMENLKQWTRFQFEWQEDKLKRDLENWEVAYFAINPKYVKDLVKGFFNPPDREDIDEIHVTPSLAYTTQDMANENWSYQFSDIRTGDELFAQTVLEVFLRPESYDIIPVDDSSQINGKDDLKIVPVHWKAYFKKDLYPKSILVKIFDKK